MVERIGFGHPQDEGQRGELTADAPFERTNVSQQFSVSLDTHTRPKLTFRRNRDPPRNADGHIFCDHSNCREQPPLFRRPCEWNKHMDKHDRPYKCANPECAKLPGFTYSGGLLRHQREVHSLHSRGKRLMCPFSDCNRNSGKGFTRQENLKEHLRRLHREEEGTLQINNNNEAFAEASTPYDTTHKTTNLVKPENDVLGSVSPESLSMHSLTKRKRTSISISSTSEGEVIDVRALRAEVVRLRREVEQKESRLNELEKTVGELQRVIKVD